MPLHRAYEFHAASSVVKSNAFYFTAQAVPHFHHTYAEPHSGAAVDKTLALAGSAYTMTSIHAPDFSSFPYI